MALKRENIIRSAEKYVSKGKLEAAIKEYRKVLAENPNDTNTLNRVGDLYARLERFDEAVRLFSQIAEQYTREGFYLKAIAIYKKIIKLDPTALMVYERLAELYHKQGLLNEARAQYQVLADYYQKHDNAASAITIYQRMSELEPDNPTFHLKLADLYRSQRLNEKAVREYRQLADLLIVNGSVDEAVQVYVTALEIAADNLDFVRESVGGLNDGGHVSAAAQVLAKAVELNPAAKSIAAEVGLGEGEEAAPAQPAAEEAVAEQPDVEEAVAEQPDAEEAVAEQPDVAEDTAPSFAADDAFELPEVSFDDAAAAMEEAASFGDEATAPAAEAPDFGDDEDGVFTLDLDDDEEPDTMVKPPEDLVAADETAGVGAADDEIELDLEAAEDAAAAVDESLQAGGYGEETMALGATAEEPPVEIEWDATMDDLDLELPAADDEPVEAAAGTAEAPAEAEQAEQAEKVEEHAFTLDLDDDEEAAMLAATEEAPAAEAAEEFSLDLEELEEEATLVTPTADAGAAEAEVEAEAVAETEAAPAEEEPEPPAVRREEDLMAEARVFAKYGLKEKARDRLAELLEFHPHHLEGLQLRVRLDLDSGNVAEVATGANELARVSEEVGDVSYWHDLRAVLAEAGYAIEGDRVVGEPGAKPADDDRIAQLLEDLSLESFEGAERDEAEAQEASALGALLEQDTAAATEAPPPTPAADAGEEAGAGEGRQLVSLVDELGLDELEEEEEVAQAGPAAAADAAQQADQLDETGMSWLDEPPSEAVAPAAAPADTIFDEEDDFFDLAAELEAELDLDEVGEGTTYAPPQEQSLEEIIEGFKQGVAENLSAQDYDTHFNLGIAYREMGLLDEAIGEFQLASKDPRHLVESVSMLGLCLLDKGLPELAVRWYRKGLEAPDISEEATLGLLYDMGEAYVSLGDPEAAYRTFVEIYGMNSNFRDVSARIQELAPQQT